MHKYLSKLLLKLTRPSRLRRLKELRENEFCSPEILRDQQEKRFLDLIKHAKINIPYYRKILNGIKIESLDDITAIPFLTKKIINQEMDSLKAENLPPGRFIRNSTGGSTGEKLIFFNDSNENLDAFLMRGNSWTGWEVGEKQAQLWGAHYDVARARILFNRFKHLMVHRKIMMSSYRMSEHDMAEYLDMINKHKPSLLTGYSSALNLFSEFIRNNNLHVYSPKGIISSAETLHEYQRKTIQSVFQSKVLNRYGCREVGNIAHECLEQKGMHIFTEHVFIEIINENGEPCEAGETGEIVITKLDNYSFPFIRYRIGDLGVLSGRTCPCGRNLPLLEEVKGRVFDLIVGTNGNHLSGTFWTILLREFVEGIRQYQVIQEKYGELLLRLIVDRNYSRDSESKLVKKIKENCGEAMSVEIEIVDELPLAESGKHRFIISKVSPFVN